MWAACVIQNASVPTLLNEKKDVDWGIVHLTLTIHMLKP